MDKFITDTEKLFEEEVREKLADIEHDRWSKWQKYMHSKMERISTARWSLSDELFQRWERQINTRYAELSEKEKDSDREQVDMYLPLIKQFLKSKLQEAFEKGMFSGQSEGWNDANKNKMYEKKQLIEKIEAEKKLMQDVSINSRTKRDIHADNIRNMGFNSGLNKAINIIKEI